MQVILRCSDSMNQDLRLEAREGLTGGAAAETVIFGKVITNTIKNKRNTGNFIVP